LTGAKTQLRGTDEHSTSKIDGRHIEDLIRLLISFKDVVKAQIPPLQHLRGEVLLSILTAYPSLF